MDFQKTTFQWRQTLKAKSSAANRARQNVAGHEGWRTRVALHEVRDRPASAGGEDTAGPPWGLTWPALERRVRPALGGRTGGLALVGVHAASPGEMPWGRRPGEYP